MVNTATSFEEVSGRTTIASEITSGLSKLERFLPLGGMSGTAFVPLDLLVTDTVEDLGTESLTKAARAGVLVEALDARRGEETYMATIRLWAAELREETAKNPHMLPLPPEQLYDATYAELRELERRSL